jgi:hypothetical protein
MGIVGRGPVLALAVAVLGAAVAPAAAEDNPNGVVFRSVGFFKGKAEITAGEIKCEIPNVSTAITEGTFYIGLWNTYGIPTLFYPDINNPFGNPCGVWVQMQNNLRDQGIIVDRIELRFRIAGANRFRGSVPTQNAFPVACRQFRRDTLFLGSRLNPVNSSEDTSSSGAPNVAFIELLPMVSPQLISCLRSQYAGIPASTFASLPLIVRATAIGIADSGETYRANTIRYTLNLRHSCGNGRVDDGEFCDPNSVLNACVGVCNSNVCSQSEDLPCQTDADCLGSCVAPDDPSECLCAY